MSRDSSEALMNIQYPFLIQAISKPKPDHGSISLLRMLFICIFHVLDLFSTSLIFSPQFYLYWVISFEFCWACIYFVISVLIANLFFVKFICLFFAALGLCCCARAFSSCGEWGLLFVVVHGLLIAVSSLVAEHGL